MVQAVWSTSQGRPLESTHGADRASRWCASAVTQTRFSCCSRRCGSLWPSPLSLAFAQIAVVSLGALPVFWLGPAPSRDERVAGLLALGYLAYPWVATSAVAAIHPVTFAITLFLFCIWFLDTDRLVPFAVCAGLAMSTGELMGLPDPRARGSGSRSRADVGWPEPLIALAGFAWTFVAVYVIVPHFRRRGQHLLRLLRPRRRLAAGRPPDAVLGSRRGARRALRGPRRRLPRLARAPAALPVRALAGARAVALPQLLANGLSDFRSMTDPRYHSVAAVIPFLIAATVFGVARVSTGTAAACCRRCAGLLGRCSRWRRPVEPGSSARRRSADARAFRRRESRRSLRPSRSFPDDARSRVEHGRRASLGTAIRLLGPAPRPCDLGRRRSRRPVGREPGLADPHHDPERVRAFVARLESDPAWRTVFEREGVLVLRRHRG